MSSIGIDDRSAAVNRAALTLALRFQFDKALTACEVAADVVAVVLAVLTAYSSYHMLQLGRRLQYRWDHVALVALGFSVLFVVLLDRDGAYRKGASLLRIRETERILRVSTTTFLLVFSATFFGNRAVSRWSVLLAFAVVPLFLILEKQLVYAVVRGLHQRGYGVKKVVVYGAGFTGRRVISALMRSPKVGLLPVALVDDDPGLAGGVVYEASYRHEHPIPILAGFNAGEVVRRTGAEMLVVAIPSLDPKKCPSILAECAANGVQLAFVPGQAFGSECLTEYAEIDGLLLSSFVQPSTKRVYEISKRICDVLFATVLTVLLSPLLILIGTLVRLDSDGPSLFRQRRVGQNGKLFLMYKFRTMYADRSGYDYSPKDSNDPRITRIGRVLRKTSLDELPQLLNVIKGDMSLVGPRPEMPFVVERYSARERQRLQVIPGITGLWQLSADRAFLIHENIQYDLYYIRNRSFFTDIAILVHTLVFAMRGA